MVVGLAGRAIKRMRAPSPDTRLLSRAGMLPRSAVATRELAERLVVPPTRLAAKALSWAGRQTMGSDAARRTREILESIAMRRARESREHMERMVQDARKRGEASMAEGRSQAVTLARSTFSHGLSWVQAKAVPPLVDALVPKLIDRLVPKLIDDALAEIRTRLVPAVIDELTKGAELPKIVREHEREAWDGAEPQPVAPAADAAQRVAPAVRSGVDPRNHNELAPGDLGSADAPAGQIGANDEDRGEPRSTDLASGGLGGAELNRGEPERR